MAITKALVRVTKHLQSNYEVATSKLESSLLRNIFSEVCRMKLYRCNICENTVFTYFYARPKNDFFYSFRSQTIWRMLKIFSDWLMKRLPSKLHFLNKSLALLFPMPKRLYSLSSLEMKRPSTSRSTAISDSAMFNLSHHYFYFTSRDGDKTKLFCDQTQFPMIMKCNLVSQSSFSIHF